MTLIRRAGGRRTETIPYQHTRIPRFAWHVPPWKYDTSAGLQAYQPSTNPLRASETRAVFEEFGEARVRAEGILWLAAETDGDAWKSFARRGVRIDLSKLDHGRLEPTGNGYFWHLGNIPASALVSGRAARGVAGDPTWPERCEEILWRRAAGETLKAIGASMGLSKERVRQIEFLCKHKKATLELQCDHEPGEYVHCWLARDGEPVEGAYAEIHFMWAEDLGKDEDLTGWHPSVFRGGWVGFLTGIELPRELRGAGWGRRLEEAVLAAARDEGVSHVYTLSLWDAVDFHAALGFDGLEAGVATMLMVWAP